MNIIGISSYFHDSAACLIQDGVLVAAVQEERFTRIKQDASFPKNAISYCLQVGNLKPEDINFVAFYEKPLLKLERIFETYLSFAPSGFKNFLDTAPFWIKNKFSLKDNLLSDMEYFFGSAINWDEKLRFSEHHLSHAASAFFPSPFRKAAILTLDGVGERTTTSLSIGDENRLQIVKEIDFPNSLGLLYSAFTSYLGFKVNSGEYKMMGLAPYGKPRYVKTISDNLIDIKSDGSFALNMKYFSFATSNRPTNRHFDELFGGFSRAPETDLNQNHMDIAASIQKVLDEIVIRLAKDASKSTGLNKLCLAGGVALNCVSNGNLLRSEIFDEIWIQPAAGDAGGAIGAAFAVQHLMLNMPRKANEITDSMQGAYLGPEFTEKEVVKSLNLCGAIFDVVDEDSIIELVAHALKDGSVVGWMNGRMEFGPRSLGNRSILADPRSPSMQKELNLKVKFRESFRPFAPSVMKNKVGEWFELKSDNPYMLFVANVREEKRLDVDPAAASLFGINKLNIQRSVIPAVTHLDFSARVQTVDSDTNLKFYRLLDKFNDLTGCPILVNTSFNVRGEPIVCTPEDAYRCFMGTNIDILAIGNIILYKSKQTNTNNNDYLKSFNLD